MDSQNQGIFDAETGEYSSVDNFYDIIKDESWCVYMGSGVSASVSGTWRDLIADLCSECGVSINQDDLANEDLLLKLADSAWDANTTKFCEYLYNKFGPLNLGDSRLYSWIMKLPFKAYLTTNYDHGLISYNGVGQCKCTVSVYPHISPTSIGAKPILYLHGRIDSRNFENESIILGSKSFEKGYNDTSPLVDVIRSLLLYENLIVFGAKLKEPQLNKLIKQIYDVSAQRIADHKIPQKKKIIVIPGIHPKRGDSINREINPKEYIDYQGFRSEVRSLIEIGFSVYCYETTIHSGHQEFEIFMNSLSRVHESIQSWEIK